MASAKEVRGKKRGEGAPLLNGTVVPKKMWAGFNLKVKDVREAPADWTGLFIIEFEPVKGLPNGPDDKPYTAWCANKTNTTAIANMHGDDTDRWKGKNIPLVVIMANNPQTKKTGPSLAVIADE